MYKYEALTAVLQWSGKMVNKYGEREKAPNKLHEPVPLFPTFLLLYITCNIMHLHVHVYLCSKKMEHSQAEHCDKRRQCFFSLRNNASMFQCFLYWMLNGYASLWQRRVCITPHFIASAAEHFRDHCN